MIDRYERQARNEALMREVNERIAKLDKTAEKKSFDAVGEDWRSAGRPRVSTRLACGPQTGMVRRGS